MTQEDRYLNLAVISVGEALTEMANRRQRGCMPGADYAVAREKLDRAIAALWGRLWVPEVPSHD